MKNKKNTGSNPPRTKKGDTTRVLIRLLRYMTGSGSGSKFTGAMVLQVIGLLALITHSPLHGECRQYIQWN